MKFINRTDAGKKLAARIVRRGFDPDSIVLALPRGGIPVGYEVAIELALPLDVLVMRKLGFPGHEEFAMGAIASGGTIVLDEELISQSSIPRHTVDAVILKEEQELERREIAYRDGRVRTPVEGKAVILVDDGLATGSTMRAAIRALRKESPRSITAAVPVGARDTCNLVASEADLMICAITPDPFHAVGLWYEDFSQTTDDEVHECLRLAFEQEAKDSVTATEAPDKHSIRQRVWRKF